MSKTIESMFIEILEKYLDENTELIFQKAPFDNERYIVKIKKIYRNTPFYAAKMFYKDDICYIDLILNDLKILLNNEVLKREKKVYELVGGLKQDV